MWLKILCNVSFAVFVTYKNPLSIESDYTWHSSQPFIFKIKWWPGVVPYCFIEHVFINIFICPSLWLIYSLNSQAVATTF